MTPPRRQRTIARAVETNGRGVHSGGDCALRILPAPAGTGIRFRRVDQEGAPEVPASIDSIVASEMARRTTLAANRTKVMTVEHVLSALHGMEIDNAIIEMTAAEAPFLDGSALPFARMLQAVGAEEQEPEVVVFAPRAPLSFTHDGASYTVLPSHGLRVTYFLESVNPLVRAQACSVVVDTATYVDQVAPARTFCFFDEIEPLLAQGLIAGGSLASAVVIGRKSIINGDLRFPDEPSRHKVLDFIGDVALLGKSLRGHFLVARGGHRSNAAFCEFLRKEAGQ